MSEPVIWKWWNRSRTSTDTLVYCQDRYELGKALQFTRSSGLTLALAKAERSYRNDQAAEEGQIFGIVHQRFATLNPFLPVKMVFRTPSRYAQIEDAHGSSRLSIEKVGLEPAFADEIDERHYQATVSVADEDLKIFGAVERQMLSSLSSGEQFFHVELRLNDLRAQGPAQEKGFDSEYSRFSAWVKHLEEPEYFYFKTPFDYLVYFSRVELRCPPWGARWEEGPLHKTHFHSGTIRKIRALRRKKDALN